MAWSSAATAASPGSSRSTSTRTSAGAASPTTTTQPHSPRATRTGAYSSALSSESVRRRLTHGASSGSLPASDVGHSDSSDTARSSRNESDVSPPSLLSMAFVERRRGLTCDAPSARRLSCTPTTSATAGPSRACCPARCAARRSARGRSQRGPATRRWAASLDAALCPGYAYYIVRAHHLRCDAPFNALAAGLAGQPIYGDAVFVRARNVHG